MRYIFKNKFHHCKKQALWPAIFAAMMILFLSNFTVLASSVSEDSGTINIQNSNVFYMVNPLYAGLVNENELNRLPAVSVTPENLLSADKCSSTDEMAEELRNNMAARKETVYVYFELPGTNYNATQLVNMESDVLKKAVTHIVGGAGNMGDYLKWGYSGVGMQVSYGKSSGNTIGTLTYKFTYYTTAAQEAQVTSKVNSISSSLNLASKGEYEKIEAVYEYVCNNVKYNYGKSNIKYSCFAAAINNSAVCQGYSLLIYRLLNDAGVDCRLVAGNTSSGNHGWNIVRVGNLYYNLDSTWDAGKKLSTYKYYMKCDKNFVDHKRWSDYSSSSFYAAFPMSSRDYDYGTGSESETEKLKGLKIVKANLKLAKGETAVIKVDSKPNGVKLKGLKYKSSNKKVAKVDSSGKVTAVKAGTCIITVSTSDGAISDKCYVTVTKDSAVKTLKLSKKKLSLKKGSKFKLSAKIKPAAASKTKLKWESSDKSIAKVSSKGVVTAKKAGTCTITVKTKNGQKVATCKVTVK
ncbi:Ig-like domain-containing protein [Butyrivibrio sp. WCD3002]|uniref:Ig-like domain-containing protein n=1 Tax=Butyrivibrio sp. WCD3002 TaxID=1280676 RepID=UPI00042103B8|nr:Ig-like domain-containing protein [Butyrivibrio sp. WCD3002]